MDSGYERIFLNTGFPECFINCQFHTATIPSLPVLAVQKRITNGVFPKLFSQWRNIAKVDFTIRHFAQRLYFRFLGVCKRRRVVQINLITNDFAHNVSTRNDRDNARFLLPHRRAGDRLSDCCHQFAVTTNRKDRLSMAPVFRYLRCRFA